MTSALHTARLLPTYPPVPVTFTRGEGMWLFDEDSRRYLDFGGGIAVVALGHRHPAVQRAAQEQLDLIWHASNLFGTVPGAQLAERLSARFGATGAQAFLCNSGAEAVEAAIKYATKATGKHGIVALEGSFHGRTLGALAATGQPAKRAAFQDLLTPVTFVSPGDVDALEAAVGPDTALILLEVIQGEGGVRPLPVEFVRAAAALDPLLCIDEIQTGVGRTGTFFAFEQLDVRPDLVTLAKGLANGLPIGCLLVSEEAAGAFVPGDHGSTFAGGPVACAAAQAVLDLVDDPALLREVRELGARLREGLEELAGVREVRGRGLMVGVGLADGIDARAVGSTLLERGLVVNVPAPDTLRLLPPLVVDREQIDAAIGLIGESL